jgi:hypothetical protein
MKNIFLILLLIYIKFSSFGQIEFGLKAGVNSIDLISNGINFDLNNKKLKLDYVDSKFSHHLGIYSRVKLLGFYIEPSAIFNSSRASYRLTDYTEGELVSNILEEKYYSIDVPVMAGIKAGFFRIYGGPVGHIHISSASDLFKISSYKQRFKDATYGYQAGFGVDIWKLRLDLAYEGNLSKFGNHIEIGGNNLKFNTAASRFLATVGYKL